MNNAKDLAILLGNAEHKGVIRLSSVFMGKKTFGFLIFGFTRKYCKIQFFL